MKAQNFELINFFTDEPSIVKGYPCRIYKDYKFFVYKSGRKKWNVAELTTGKKVDIWDSSTMWEAIQKAVTKVNANADILDEKIESGVRHRKELEDARNHRAE